MKKLLTLIFIIISFATNFALAAIPKVEEVVSKGGYKAWVIEDDYLPIVSVKITFTKSGVAYDYEGKEGLAYMVSGLLDEGAGGISSLDYRKKLEELATSISFNADKDNFHVSIKTLKENLEESLKLVNLTLTKPDFKPDAVERIRNQILVIIEKQKENPRYVASRKFDETIFVNHPYGKSKFGTPESIKSLKRDDFISFVNNNFTDENIVISVVGDVKKKQVADLLDKYLKIPSASKEIKAFPKIVINDNGERVDIPKDITQSVVLFGAKGVKRNDEDFYPAYIMNHILGGGGFESRLMDVVREKNGLAYTIYSYLDIYSEAGLFSGYVGTDGTKVNQSIDLIKSEIKKMQEKGVTEQELNDAKDYLINSFPLKMTKNENLAEFLSVMQTENLGIDFLEKRNGYVKDVTTQQIKQVAKRLLDVNKMTFVVVGGK
ncbi:MAG: pitrilysin family protein [Rickettsiales bacterium]|nr:pitrilysin family protein [Pseudomonadota bacterium]MDA0966446.1 pitrilysin family protein [Pseudomonadota bacterium]MDG4543308.1 pitrilysin family protein [Rickettsiales bacterium]MDG4545574.1 pitrilysin family protein [Rickettsiales bacterium]MDG4548023.1 pitrilysin family protein [Rickettsiales bacterium]